MKTSNKILFCIAALVLLAQLALALDANSLAQGNASDSNAAACPVPPAPSQNLELIGFGVVILLIIIVLLLIGLLIREPKNKELKKEVGQENARKSEAQEHAPM